MAIVRTSLGEHEDTGALLEVARRAVGPEPDVAALGLRIVASDSCLTRAGDRTVDAYREARVMLASGRVSDEMAGLFEGELLPVGALLGLTDADDVIRLAQRELTRLREHHVLGRPRLEGGEVSGAVVAEAVMWLEHFALAAELLHAHLQYSRQQGDLRGVAFGLLMGGELAFRLGRWDDGLAAFDEAARLVDSELRRSLAISVVTARASLVAARGNPLGDLEQAEVDAHAVDLEITTEYVAVARGLAALGVGDAATAAAHYERAWEWKQAARHVEPSIGTWPADRVEALILSGRRADAEAALEELRQYAERTSRRWATAAVPRLQALLCEGADPEPHFLRALEAYPAAQAPFDEARTRLAYGRFLRAQGRADEAREPLERALATFERLRAQPWIEQTHRVLGTRATTARRARHGDELTPQERQVAALVAAGRTNKDVAGELFLSPKTVEAHLSRIYRKLGISSRTQLAARWPELAEH